jgi:TATA-box binding protein (TBP) (component of TFIID and TFIIIB)
MDPRLEKYVRNRPATPIRFLFRSVNWGPQRKETFPVSQNTVVTSMLSEQQDISQLAVQFHSTKRNQAQFANLYIGFMEPKFAVLLFSSGKFICIGAKTPSVASYGLYTARKFLRSKSEFEVPRVNNTVFTVSCPYRIDIVNMSLDNMHLCKFRPGWFTGCKYTPEISRTAGKKPHCSNVFHTGKLTVLGTTDLETTLDFATAELEFLKPYQRPMSFGPGISPITRKPLGVQKWLEETLEAERKRRSDNADAEQQAKRQKVQEQVNGFMETLANLAGQSADPLLGMAQVAENDWF